MTHQVSTSLLDVDVQPGKPPILRVDAGPGDATAWTAVHRDALRGLVTRHGALLVRGLGLRDAVDFRGWVAPSDAPALIESATLVRLGRTASSSWHWTGSGSWPTPGSG